MTTKKTRKTHTEEFKQEAVKLAARQGVAKAEKELGVYESQIYDWHTKQIRKANINQHESELSA